MFWISHRGVRGKYVENSLLAFREAVDKGFDCLETDLRTTIDGHVVLSHDASLARLSGSDITIENSSYLQLSRIKLKDGQKILSLEQFLSAFSRMPIIWDIKPESGTKTLEVLHAKGYMPELLSNGRFLFWSVKQEKLFKMTHPGARILGNQKECLRAGIRCICPIPIKIGEKGKTYSLPPSFLGLSLFKQKYVSKYHDCNARVIAFLPGCREEVENAVSAGFDEVLTDGIILKR